MSTVCVKSINLIINDRVTEVLLRITVFFPSLNVVQVLYWYIQVYHFQDPVAGF